MVATLTASLGRPGNEHHLELCYSHQVDDNLTTMLDIQWVKNANGDSDNGNVWVFGVRTQLGF